MQLQTEPLSAVEEHVPKHNLAHTHTYNIVISLGSSGRLAAHAASSVTPMQSSTPADLSCQCWRTWHHPRPRARTVPSGLRRLCMGSAISSRPTMLPATSGTCVTTRSTEGAEQAAQITPQAPPAGWSWHNQVAPFPNLPAWVMVGPAITLRCFLRLSSIARQVVKPFPKTHRQKTGGHVIVTLTWKKAFRSMMKGLSFSLLPRKQPWVGTEQRDEVPKTRNSFPRSFHPPSAPRQRSHTRPPEQQQGRGLSTRPLQPHHPHPHTGQNYFPILSSWWSGCATEICHD